MSFIQELFENEYILSYYMGESLSSVIPSTITFFQRISDNVHECKNVTVYDEFTNQSSIEPQLISINPNPFFSPSIFFTIIFIFMLMSLLSFVILNKNFKKSKKPFINESKKINENDLFLEQNENNSNETANQITKKRSILMFLAFIVSFFMYGILPSISSYSTLPYSYRAFNLSINLGTFTHAYTVKSKLERVNLMAPNGHRVI